jgi:hypothetical protein
LPPKREVLQTHHEDSGHTDSDQGPIGRLAASAILCLVGGYLGLEGAPRNGRGDIKSGRSLSRIGTTMFLLGSALLMTALFPSTYFWWL